MDKAFKWAKAHPLWLLGGVAAAGLLYWYLRSRSSASTTAAGSTGGTTDTGTQTGSGSGTSSSTPGETTAPPWTWTPGTGTGAPTPASPTNPATTSTALSGTTALAQLNSGIPQTAQMTLSGNDELTYTPSAGYSGVVTSPSGLEPAAVTGGAVSSQYSPTQGAQALSDSLSELYASASAAGTNTLTPTEQAAAVQAASQPVPLYDGYGSAAAENAAVAAAQAGLHTA